MKSMSIPTAEHFSVTTEVYTARIPRPDTAAMEAIGATPKAGCGDPHFAWSIKPSISVLHSGKTVICLKDLLGREEATRVLSDLCSSVGCEVIEAPRLINALTKAHTEADLHAGELDCVSEAHEHWWKCDADGVSVSMNTKGTVWMGRLPSVAAQEAAWAHALTHVA